MTVDLDSFILKHRIVAIIAFVSWLTVQNVICVWLYSWLFKLSLWNCCMPVVYQALTLLVLVPLTCWMFQTFHPPLACLTYTLVSIGCVVDLCLRAGLLPTDIIARKDPSTSSILLMGGFDAWSAVLIVSFALACCLAFRMVPSGRNLMWCAAFAAIVCAMNNRSIAYLDRLIDVSVPMDTKIMHKKIYKEVDQVPLLQGEQEENPYMETTVSMWDIEEPSRDWWGCIRTFALFVWTSSVFASAATMGTRYLVAGWKWFLLSFISPFAVIWGYISVTCLSRAYYTHAAFDYVAVFVGLLVILAACVTELIHRQKTTTYIVL